MQSKDEIIKIVKIITDNAFDYHETGDTNTHNKQHKLSVISLQGKTGTYVCKKVVKVWNGELKKHDFILTLICAKPFNKVCLRLDKQLIRLLRIAS